MHSRRLKNQNVGKELLLSGSTGQCSSVSKVVPALLCKSRRRGLVRID